MILNTLTPPYNYVNYTTAPKYSALPRIVAPSPLPGSENLSLRRSRIHLLVSSIHQTILLLPHRIITLLSTPIPPSLCPSHCSLCNNSTFFISRLLFLGMDMDHLIGQRFNLVSKSEIRYVSPVVLFHGSSNTSARLAMSVRYMKSTLNSRRLL